MELNEFVVIKIIVSFNGLVVLKFRSLLFPQGDCKIGRSVWEALDPLEKEF